MPKRDHPRFRGPDLISKHRNKEIPIIKIKFPVNSGKTAKTVNKPKRKRIDKK